MAAVVQTRPVQTSQERPVQTSQERPEPALEIEEQFLPAKIVATCPLDELLNHLTHWEIPSFELVARTLKVLALAAFRGHVYDNIMLLRNEALVHSLDGRVEVIRNTARYAYQHSLGPILYFQINDLREFIDKHPYMLRSADYFEISVTEQIPPPTLHRFHYVRLTDRMSVKVPDFSDYSFITPDSVARYFNEYERISISGNTISSLLNCQQVKKIPDGPLKLHHFRAPDAIGDEIYGKF